MHHEYELLLGTFLKLESMGRHFAEYDHAITEFFGVKTHIYGEVQWVQIMRIACFLMCSVQFVQLTIYFNAHPRMAVLTNSFSKRIDLMVHVFIVFLVPFFMRAFMAYWLFGQLVAVFQDWGTTIESQARMIFGTFLLPDGAEHLYGKQRAMYWLYALTFLLVMIFTLLNFFLAIVVVALGRSPGPTPSGSPTKRVRA